VRDRILVEGLAARCILGVRPEERRRRRPVEVDLLLETPLRGPGRSDRIGDAVDYAAVSAAVLRAIEGSRFLLLERLAEEVARTVLEGFPRVSAVGVTVRKPGAVRRARTVAVGIRRARAGGQIRGRRRAGSS
jgi:FolB domain-containing protein